MLPRTVPQRINKVDLTDAGDINDLMENTQYLDENKADKNILLEIDHAYGGTVRPCPYGEAIKFGDLVYQSANGKVFKTLASSLATMPAVGMALGDGSTDSYNPVLFSGMVRIDTLNLTVGANIYASASTAGAITQTKPVSPNQIQIIGRSTASNIILFAPQFINVNEITDRVSTLESYFTQPNVAKKAISLQPTLYTGTEDFLTYAVKQRVSRFNPGHTNAPNATDWFTVEWISSFPDNGITVGHLIARSEASQAMYVNAGTASNTFNGWTLVIDANGYAVKTECLVANSDFTSGDLLALIKTDFAGFSGVKTYIARSACDNNPAGADIRIVAVGNNTDMTITSYVIGTVSNKSQYVNQLVAGIWKGWVAILDNSGNSVMANSLNCITIASGDVTTTMISTYPKGGVFNAVAGTETTGKPGNDTGNYWTFFVTGYYINTTSGCKTIYAIKEGTKETYSYVWQNGASAGWTKLTDASGNAINANTVAGKTVGNASGNVPLSNGTVNTGLNADMLDGCHLSALIPLSSNFHHRKDFNKVKSSTARTTLVIPNFIETVINGAVYYNRTAYDIDISAPTYWDAVGYTAASSRAGKDFYIYACIPTIGDILDIKISANSTYPTGYTAINSRKIGGFHCLCVSAGTSVYGYINEGKDADYLDAIYYEGSTIANGDTSHWLKNFVQGDILPFSCWDLEHRPNENADVAGKVYDPKSGLWVDIYLPSWNAGLQKLLSVYGGTIADGASSPAFHWYRFSQVFANQGQRLPRQDHFVACSLGSPQGASISPSADPITTGGHTATNSLRIISNIGVEDGTGVLGQWGSGSGTNTATVYTNAYDANDKNVGGQQYSDITRPFFGGRWSDGVRCGSRGSAWDFCGLTWSSEVSGRGFAEPK